MIESEVTTAGIVDMISGESAGAATSSCVCDEDIPTPTCDCYDAGPATDDGPDE